MKKQLKKVLIFVMAFVMLFAAACTETTPKEKYTVTFNSMSGSTVAPQTIEEGLTATKPSPDPTREGYTFAQWHTDEDCTLPYVFETPVNANLTLYAKWTAIPVPEYTVTFNSKGGSSVQPQTIIEGQKATKPSPDPILANNNFAQWYKDEACTQLYDFNTAVTGTLTLYAKWTPVPQFAVVFNSDGGTAVAEQLVYEGGLVVKPSDPTRKNYEFDGWYYDHDDDGMIEERLWEFDSFSVTGSIILNAHWNQTHYEMKFVTNTETEVNDQSIEFGGKAEEPAALTKEGYTFVGWYTSVAFTTKWNFDNELDTDRTLHARWYENKSVDADLSDWSEAELENYIVCRGHNNAAETRGFTLYAKYVKDAGLWISGYGDHNVSATTESAWHRRTNIEFRINGGGQQRISVLRTGETIYQTALDGSATGSKIMIKTLAKSEEGNEHFPNTYRTYWEVFYPEANIPNNVPGGPQRIGFAFCPSHGDNGAALREMANLGNRNDQFFWCNEGKDPNNSVNGYYVFDDVIARGTFVNANRTPVTGTITFNSNGGSAVTPDSVQIGQKLSRPADPTRTDFIFDGWYKDSALTLAWEFDKDIVIQSYPLYAKWTPGVKYAVTFNANGADTNIPDNISDIWVGDLITEPSPIPGKTGYVFMGWYKDAALETPWVFTGSSADRLFGNVTLYAKWIEIQTFQVTFESNGGSDVASQNVETGGVVVKPTNPTKSGYTFIAWCKDSALTTQWNFTNDKVGDAVTLYAQWYKTPDGNTDDWFNGETPLYEGVKLRDNAGDKDRGVDVYAYVATEGIYIAMIVYHDNALKITSSGNWYDASNAEFWINGVQQYYSLRSNQKSGGVTSATYKTAAGSTVGATTNHVTVYEIFCAGQYAQGVRMAFAAKPDGGAEKITIKGFTGGNPAGTDAWWILTTRTVRAQTENLSFGDLYWDNGGTNWSFWVYNDGIQMTAKS